MRVDVIGIFPEYLAPLELSIVGRARAAGLLTVAAHDLRDWTHDVHRTVDDTPYGGGAGMVIRVDVVEAALVARYGASAGRGASAAGADEPGRRIVALAAGGRQFDDALAEELASEPALTLLCGRYEGFDERVAEHLATDVVSIGPYVLAGGELAAMVVGDAVIRKLPGALGHADSAVEESFSTALGGAPEYPHYTRPVEWRGHRVPEILLSGDHARVAAWRMERSRERGRAREPDS